MESEFQKSDCLVSIRSSLKMLPPEFWSCWIFFFYPLAIWISPLLPFVGGLTSFIRQAVCLCPPSILPRAFVVANVKSLSLVCLCISDDSLEVSCVEEVCVGKWGHVVTECSAQHTRSEPGKGRPFRCTTNNLHWWLIIWKWKPN